MNRMLSLLVVATAMTAVYGFCACTPDSCSQNECKEITEDDCSSSETYDETGGACGCCSACVTLTGNVIYLMGSATNSLLPYNRFYLLTL